MATSMQDYLKRYNATTTTRGDDEIKVKPKKKRKVKGGASSKLGNGVVIVDNDGVWKKEGKLDDDDPPDDEADKPTVIEDVDVKVMHRMEALKSHRPYLSVANDGSGWVTVKDDAEEGRDEISGDSERNRRVESRDLSPPRNRTDSFGLSPRKSRNDSPDMSPPRRRKQEDMSPPRKRNGSVDVSPPRRKNIDLSPPRRRNGSPDISPPRRRKDANLSPPRRRNGSPGTSSPRWRKDADLSPPRRRNGSPDISPPRRRKDADSSPPRRRNDSPEMSPRRRKDVDLSPPRRRNDSPDTSPPRRTRKDTDLSPPRRRNGSPDISPPRRRKDTDLSPPRRNPTRNDSPDLSPPRKKVSRFGEAMEGKNTKKPRMADGSVGGLKTEKEVVEEIQRKKAMEKKALADLDPSESGRGAETVYRDKRGRRLEGLEELLRQQKGEAKPVEQPLEWGKGLAQKKEMEAKFAELEAEKNKPFSRTRDDAELEKSLKEAVRWGDPMAHLVKKKMPEPVLPDFGASEEMKASGFIVPQDIPSHSWLKRGIAPPANRYGIKPGRHWDGVDRSTGYERDMFKAKNEKQAMEREAYLWSVSDM
ncbi:pre-mRNA-splicing factor CWC26 [Marchantia polymorpha subsp. ruderalis]